VSECEFWVVWDLDQGPRVQAVYTEEIDALRFAVNQGYGLKVTGISPGEIREQLDGARKSGGAPIDFCRCGHMLFNHAATGRCRALVMGATSGQRVIEEHNCSCHEYHPNETRTSQTIAGTTPGGDI
jgi:hypothetical protein